MIARAGRTDAGYRIYSDRDVNTLRFIHRAREFGFPIERIRLLVGLWQGGNPGREVKHVAIEHAADLDRKIAKLTAMRDTLQELAALSWRQSARMPDPGGRSGRLARALLVEGSQDGFGRCTMAGPRMTLGLRPTC